jgi:GAF domain-containing protein
VRDLKTGQQVVHHDTRLLFDDAELQQLLRLYGDVRAQVVTPILLRDELIAVVSVHQLDRARIWSQQEVTLCRAAADEIGRIV